MCVDWPSLVPFRRRIRQAEHHFVHGVVQLSFLIGHIEKHTDSAVDELLEGIADLDGLTAQARFFTHNEHMKGWPRLESVHESQKPRAFNKLCARDSVIAIDKVLCDGPTFLHRIGSGMLDLSSDRLVLVT